MVVATSAPGHGGRRDGVGDMTRGPTIRLACYTGAQNTTLHAAQRPRHESRRVWTRLELAHLIYGATKSALAFIPPKPKELHKAARGGRPPSDARPKLTWVRLGSGSGLGLGLGSGSGLGLGP